MIPLVSISHLVALIFFALITFRLYFSFQKTKEKNIKYFFIFFLIFTIMEGLLASPGLVFKDLMKIDAVFALYPMFMLLGLGFLGAIPFSIMKMKKSETFFLLSMLLINIFITIINLNNIQFAVTRLDSPFIYWEDTRGAPMNIFLGIVPGIILCFAVLFFFINGLKSSEKYVKTRSFLIAGGLAATFSAAIINFVLGAVLRQHITSLISTFLLIASGIFIFIGVLYKKEGQQNKI